MGIKAAFQSLIAKWKFRTKTLPKRFNELHVQFENLIQEVHSHNTIKLEQLNDHKYESMVTIIQQLKHDISFSIERVDGYIESEKKNRLAQGKRASDKFKAHSIKTVAEFEEIKKGFKDVNVNFKSIDKEISKINDVLNKKNHKVAAMLERLEWALENFAHIETLVHQANKEYEMYLDQLKVDISTFKKNDSAVIRLAHLEERITLMEVNHRERSHNGSGETTSGSIRPN